jgi:hypothetical protein
MVLVTTAPAPKRIHVPIASPLQVAGPDDTISGLSRISPAKFVLIICHLQNSISTGKDEELTDSLAKQRFAHLRYHTSLSVCAWVAEDYHDALSQLAQFLDEVYMHKRIHSALGYLTPAEFESP